MFNYRYNRAFYLYMPILSTFFLLSTLLTSHAAPKVGSIQLNGSGSIQTLSKSWGILKTRLSNPDNKDVVVELKVLPALNSFTDFNVFSEKVTIPAKSELIYTTPVYLDNKIEFKVQVFANGREISSGKVNIKQLPKSSSLSLVLNDSEDNYFYTTSKIPSFKETCATPTTSCRNVPDSWIALKELSSLIIIDPNYSLLSPVQYQAIIDYVHQGGTLIFANPKGTTEAVNTPLVSLLPVTPVRVTNDANLASLNAYVPGIAQHFSKTTNILISHPKGEGLTVAGNEQFPIIRWKKFGAGTVKYIAFTPNKESIKNEGAAEKLIQKLIPIKQNSKKTETSYSGFQGYLDQMTGIKIPSIGLIQIIFVVYFVVLILTALACNYTKRSGLLWIAMSGVSIIFAVVIVLKATSTGLSGKTIISEIKMTTPGSESSTSHSLFSAFSGADSDLQISSVAPQASFASFPQSITTTIASSKTPRNKAKQKRRIAKSFLVSRKEGLSSLDGHKLRANVPLQFQALSSDSRFNIGASPVVTLTDNQYQLAPWRLPQGISCSKAILVLPSKEIVLSLNEDVLSIPGSPQTDTKAALTSALLKHTKSASPYIGLVCDSKPDSLQVTEDVLYNGTEYHIIPVQLQIEKSSITFNKDFITLTTNNKKAQNILFEDMKSREISSRGQERHKLQASIPKTLSVATPEQIMIKFNYSSTDKQFEVVPALSKGKKQVWGSQKEPGVFVFNKQQIRRVYDSANASFEITFHERFKNNARRGRKSILWTPQQFSISIKSRLPDGMAPLKY